MSDCSVTGGTHVFVPVDTSTDDAEGRVTEVSRCGCGATQTITGPARKRDDPMAEAGKLLIDMFSLVDPDQIAQAATVFDPPMYRGYQYPFTS